MAESKAKRGRPVDDELLQRRCEEILDCAVELFADRGFGEADTEELARRVGVGKGTLYRYFPSKRELFLAAADRVMRQLRERIDRAVADRADALEQISVAIEAFLTFFDEHPSSAELLIQERALFKDRKKPTYLEHREQNVGRWNAVYQSLIAEGRVRPLAVERITSVTSDLIYGTMFSNHLAGRNRSLREQAEDIVQIVFCGILGAEERKRWEKSS